MANKALKGNYYIPDNIKKQLQNAIDKGDGGKNRRRIIGYLNDGHITDREIAKLLYDYKNNNLGRNEELKLIEKLIKWAQKEIGGKAEHVYRTKKSQSDIGLENKHKRTHFKWGDDTKPIQFHNLIDIPKPTAMFEGEEYENNKLQIAIIEITKPIAYMSVDKYIQAIPYNKLLNDKIYINRGASGSITISKKNIKILQILNTNNPNIVKKAIESEQKKQNVGETIKISEEIAKTKNLMGLSEGLNLVLKEKPSLETQLKMLLKNQLEKDKSEYTYPNLWRDISWLTTEIAQYMSGNYSSSYIGLWLRKKKLVATKSDILTALSNLYPEAYNRAQNLTEWFAKPNIIEGLNLVSKKKYQDKISGNYPDGFGSLKQYWNNGIVKVLHRTFDDGSWWKREYDKGGNQIYYEDSKGNRLQNVNEGLNLPKMTPQSWFKSILNKTTQHTSPEWPDSIFFKLYNDLIFGYDKKTQYFWIDYNEIWSVFETKFNLNNTQIKELTKGMVEEHYKLGPVTTTHLKMVHGLSLWNNITIWNH